MKPKIVAFVPSEQIAILIAAFLSNRNCEQFLIILDKNSNINENVKLYLEDLGAKFCFSELNNIELHEVSEIYVHTFAQSYNYLSNIIERSMPKNAEIICYADGLKGEYSIDFIRKSNCQKMLFFGWVFDKGGLQGLSVHAMPFRKIIDVFRCFKINSKKHNFDKKSLVIMMRYWGEGIYKVREEFSAAEAMFNTIPKFIEGQIENIFIKTDPRVSDDVQKEFFDLCSRISNSTVRKFSDFYDLDESYNKFPLEFLHTEKSDSFYYAFDSTVSIYLAAIGEEKILFPDFDVVQNLFYDKDGINTVVNYSKIFKRVCEGIWKEGIERPLIINLDASVPNRLLGPASS